MNDICTVMTDKSEQVLSNMGQKKLDIICPKTLDKHFRALTLLIYCLLQTILKCNEGSKLVDYKTIAYELGYSFPLQRRKKKLIEDALDDLCDFGYAEKTEWGYLVDTNSFYNQSDGFERCPREVFELLKDDADLFRHYMLIRRGLIDGKCTYNTSYFEKIEGVSARTIARRNNDLVDLHLIAIYQPPAEEGYSNNVYVLYNGETSERMRQDNPANLNRSVSQRYNSFVKSPGKFTPLQRKELRRQVEEYNIRNPDRSKDLSVFITSPN